MANGKTYGFDPFSGPISKTYHESQYERKASTIYLEQLPSSLIETLAGYVGGLITSRQDCNSKTGSLTNEGLVDVIPENNVVEFTMWLVALVSIT